MRIRSLVCILFAAVLLALATSAVASATTVTVSPTGNKSTTFYASQFTFSTARRTMNCTYLDSVATFDTGHVVVSTNFWLAFNNSCTVTGGLRASFSCLANADLTVTGATSGGVTPGTLTGLSCTVSITATCSVRISGSAAISYNNSGSMLTVSATSQSLAATSSTCTTLPNDPNVRFTNNAGTAATAFLTPSTTITVT